MITIAGGIVLGLVAFSILRLCWEFLAILAVWLFGFACFFGFLAWLFGG